jgi:hypothetical protein
MAGTSHAASGAWLLRQRGREVTDARARLVAERDAAPRNWDSRSAHEDLLAALERLDAASARVGVPLSYRLHAELELYRRLSRRTPAVAPTRRLGEPQ